MVVGTSCIWLCQQNICLQKRCTRSQQLCVCLFKFHVRLLGPKTDQCAQYVVDIAIAANKATDIIRKVRAVFKYIRHAGLTLTKEKCRFGVRQFEFLGRLFSPEGISPQARKNQNLLRKLRFLKPKMALQRHLGFVNFCKNYTPRVVEKLNTFYKLLKAETSINITSDLRETFDSLNKAIIDRCDIVMKHPFPGKQFVLITHASFRNAGYALIIEDKPKNTIKLENVRSIGVWIEIFIRCATQIVHLLERNLAIYLVIFSLHTFCGKQRNRQSSWQITNQSRDFSRRKKFHTSLFESTEQLPFSPDWKWKTLSK